MRYLVWQARGEIPGNETDPKAHSPGARSSAGDPEARPPRLPQPSVSWKQETAASSVDLL